MFNFFGKKQRYWITPACQIWTLYKEMAEAPHCLVAGATGSGKTTVMEGMIYTTLAQRSPAKAQFVLIDTKRVALCHLRNLPHVIEYADTISTAEAALTRAAQRMEARFAEMQRQGAREYAGSDIYIVIDEAGDILTSPRKKAFSQLIQHITMLGRAAKVHLWMGSQVVTRDVISTAIKANIDGRVCLRTACAQDSRNICGQSGAENFPSPKREGKAYAYWRDGADITLYNLPRYTEEQAAYIIDWWMDASKSTAT